MARMAAPSADRDGAIALQHPLVAEDRGELEILRGLAGDKDEGGRGHGIGASESAVEHGVVRNGVVEGLAV